MAIISSKLSGAVQPRRATREPNSFAIAVLSSSAAMAGTAISLASATAARLVQSRKPPFDDSRGKTEADGALGRIGDQDAVHDQFGKHCAGLPILAAR
jgi:hypothetical protein